jgi:hypothetical protein
VRLAMITLSGEMGYPGVLSAPVWGFEDVSFDGEQLSLPQEFATYVMENVLFKISFPAEFHAQTAVEAAVTLHPQIKDKLDDIKTRKKFSRTNTYKKSFKGDSYVIGKNMLKVKHKGEERIFEMSCTKEGKEEHKSFKYISQKSNSCIINRSIF